MKIVSSLLKNKTGQVRCGLPQQNMCYLVDGKGIHSKIKVSPGVRSEGFCRWVSDRARHSASGSCYGYSEGGEL
jgi:hypothetical protein